ncbi:MAG: MFS transporter [Candidatus Gracilibacteria bacterium]|nr:MFS transporter [Candidatus Gracilibacteria bacterium]
MKNILLLVLSRFFSSLYFSIPIQALFLIKKGVPFSHMMILETVLLITVLAFEIPTGILGDKIGRKWSLVCGSLFILLSWIPWFIASSTLGFLPAFILSGVGIAFCSGSDQALIYDQLKEIKKTSSMQKIMGYYYASMTVATALAGILGGTLATSHSLSNFYLVYKLTVVAQILGLIVLLFVKEVSFSDRGDGIFHQDGKQESYLKSGITLLLQNRKLKRIALISILTIPFSFVLIYIFQLYFRAATVPNQWYGLAVFIAYILSASSSIFVYKLEHFVGAYKAVFIACFLPAICWTLMSIIFNPVLAVALFVVNTSSAQIREPLFADYLNKQITSRYRATVLSTISMLGSLYSLIMRPIIGFLGDTDLRYSFILMAFLIFFGILILWRSSKNIFCETREEEYL